MDAVGAAGFAGPHDQSAGAPGGEADGQDGGEFEGFGLVEFHAAGDVVGVQDGGECFGGSGDAAHEVPLAGRGRVEDADEEVPGARPSGRIDCKSAAFNRPYISAHGQVSACCWITGSEEEEEFLAGHSLGPERYNIRNRPLEEILLDEPFASLYARAWAADGLAVCRHKCGMMIRNRRNRLRQ